MRYFDHSPCNFLLLPSDYESVKVKKLGTRHKELTGIELKYLLSHLIKLKRCIVFVKRFKYFYKYRLKNGKMKYDNSI